MESIAEKKKDNPDAASINETAELLGVSRATVVRMLESGRIGHAAKVGGQWRINARAEWPRLFPGKEEL